MGLLLKLGSLFVSKPLSAVNGFLDGKKTFLGGALIILPGLTCLIQLALSLMPLDLGDLRKLVDSDCIKQIGQGLVAIGIGHKLVKGG